MGAQRGPLGADLVDLVQALVTGMGLEMAGEP